MEDSSVATDPTDDPFLKRDNAATGDQFNHGDDTSDPNSLQTPVMDEGHHVRLLGWIVSNRNRSPKSLALSQPDKLVLQLISRKIRIRLGLAINI